MSEVEKFLAAVRANVAAQGADADVQALSRIWLREITRYRYAYNFTWLGRPIIQLPQDLVALQEIIWQTQPELIVETGIAHGGSLIFHASILELIGGPGVVLGVDVDIRAHNRAEIERHPMVRRIRMIEGSSIDPKVVAQVRTAAASARSTMVVLDSNHTRDHVLAELHAYGSLVTKGCYLVVLDTLLEDMPDDLVRDRPWGKGNNPKTAVREYLDATDRFEIDKSIEHKLLITVAPDGYLRCVKD